MALADEFTSRAFGPITAIGVCGIGPCSLPVDSAGRPLHPAILYGVDTRAKREVAELAERFGAEAILRPGGSALSSQAVRLEMLWMRRSEPEVWAETVRFLMASSYFVERLTGIYVLDHHSASQCDPLYDIAAEVWITGSADEVAPGLALPPLVWSDEVAGTVTPKTSEATGMPAGSPVARARSMPGPKPSVLAYRPPGTPC